MANRSWLIPLLLVLAANDSFAQIPGDDCLNPILVAAGTVAYDTTGASDSPEPWSCPGGTFPGQMSNDLWFMFTATVDGTHQVSTCSTNHDTDLAVYSGDCFNLVTEACDGDNCSLQSALNWTALSGSTYLIRLGSWGAGGTGSGDLEILVSSPEICDDATDNDLDGLIDCQDLADCPPGINPCIEICDDGIDNDSDGLLDCQDELECPAGVTPCIEICDDGIDNDTDGAIDCADTDDCPTGIVPCLPPDSDLCTMATPIIEGTFSFDTTLATLDAADLASCGAVAPDVWFAYTATCSGLATVRTTSFNGLSGGTDTIVEVLDACGGNVLACDDDAGAGLLSHTDFNALIGGIYLIRVSGWGNGASHVGTGTLVVSCLSGTPEDCLDGIDNDFDGLIDCLDRIDCPPGIPPCIENCDDAVDNDGDGLIDCADWTDCPIGTFPCMTPFNDDCSNPIAINCGDLIVADTTLANPETLGVCGTSDGAAGVLWYQFTGNGDYVTFSTCSMLAQFDTRIRIWEGTCSTLQCVAGNDDSCASGSSPLLSTVEFLTVAGTRYLIAIHGTGTDSGIFELSIGCQTPSIEICDDGLDNDLDGATDCDDHDCICDLSCGNQAGLGVENLTAIPDCMQGTISLSWSPSLFEAVEIRRNGVTIASGLSPGTATFFDPSPGNGSYDYEVFGSCISGQFGISSVTTMLASPNGETDLIVVGEGAGGQVDSAQALSDALLAMNRSVLEIPGPLGRYPCFDLGFEIVWILNGTFPDAAAPLSSSDGVALAVLHAMGRGIYFESGDHWGFSPTPTLFDEIDGVASAFDGDDSFTAMDGLSSGGALDLSDFTAVPYSHDQAGNDSTDQLVLSNSDLGVSTSSAVWRQAGGGYVSGVYSAGFPPNPGTVLVQSWEFGGFGGDQLQLVQHYLIALGTPPPVEEFLRGDCNSDGIKNIADAVFGLGALFPPFGLPPNPLICGDACDVNDDGFLNIADMITILVSLFPVSDRPPISIPEPNLGCGPDSTADAISCPGYSACP